MFRLIDYAKRTAINMDPYCPSYLKVLLAAIFSKLVFAPIVFPMNFDDIPDDYVWEFDSVMDEYDPNEDPDEALWNEYYNPEPSDYIDALRAGYTFD